jgi:hypothetical protein
MAFFDNITKAFTGPGIKDAFTSATKQVFGEIPDLISSDILSVAKNVGQNALSGAVVGGALGAGTHLATGLLGSIGSPTGMTRGDWSIGGALGAGIRGAAVGGAIGANLSRISGIGNVAKLSAENLSKGVSSFEGYTSGMIGTELAPWARNMAGVAGALSPSGMAKSVSTMASNRGMDASAYVAGAASAESMGTFQALKGYATGALGEGGVTSRMGAALGLGGIGYAAYSANALGLSVPGNYGYR